MKTLFSQEEMSRSKSRDKLSFECEYCQQPFLRTRKDYLAAIRGQRPEIQYCSCRCSTTARQLKNNGELSKVVECLQCGKEFSKEPRHIKKTKNNFCSHSCCATYGNKNKKHGTQRSKLEKWLEERLLDLYPDMEFHFNRNEAIRGELDIFIPSLCLAFELNGIFHYEPIFGEDKLQSTQNNDERKFQACYERGIELCVIDSSGQKYFKPATSQKYLDIITKLVNMKLSKTDCVEVL